MNSEPRPKRAVGRPASNDAGNAQKKIVLAASLNFARHGIKGTSNQMIADEAGVTPAMVHYYFRHKADLHQAVLDAGFSPLLVQLQAASTLTAWVAAFHNHLCQRPWIPHLMIREVLPHNGLLRPVFLREFGPRVFATIHEQVRQEAVLQKAPADLDIERHIVLLMGMLVYPFLGMDLAENLTGRKFDKTMMAGFRDDALKLFTRGIAAR